MTTFHLARQKRKKKNWQSFTLRLDDSGRDTLNRLSTDDPQMFAHVRKQETTAITIRSL